MQVVHTVQALRERLKEEKAVTFVPTMGNLHEGHVDLVRRAREQGDCTVASIFVNPLQFGPNEDYEQYPRTLKEDCSKLQGLADVVFAPSVNEMYPVSQTVYIELPKIASELCGATRPGHFRGMATVVMKLFNIVRPHAALFGKKDYQQLYLIRQMTEQMNLGIKIIGCETVRAEDGLALSSRNRYLTIEERKEAPFLYQTLQAMKRRISQGERDYAKLEREAEAALASRGWQVDYVSLRSRLDLMAPYGAELVALAAARLGRARLLDNIEI
jgi:pantoate--beta-alanine ligase